MINKTNRHHKVGQGFGTVSSNAKPKGSDSVMGSEWTSDATFSKLRKADMKKFEKLFNPKLYYEKEYDIFYFVFRGNKKVNSTIEVTDDIRFDIDNKGNIIAVEIEDFMKKIKNNTIK